MIIKVGTYDYNSLVKYQSESLKLNLTPIWYKETTVPVAMLQEQQVAVEVQEASSSGIQAPMTESQIGKVPRTLIPECFMLLLCLYMLAAAIFP